MKSKYIDGLEKQELSDENLIEVKHLLLTRNVIMFSIISVILLVTLVGIPRISIFMKIFNSVSNVFQIIGLVLYFLAIAFLFIYYIYVLSLIAIYTKKEKEWVYKVYRFQKKTDIISFTSKCLAIFLFILIFFFNPCTVTGPSMNDTFHEGDKVICTDLFYYPKKNDVVIFNSHRYTGDDKFFIKRVIATEGDLITYFDGTLYVNGEKESIQRIDLIDFLGMVNGIRKKGGITGSNYAYVPNNMVLVLGDNRENSYDSAEYGPIYVNDIYGKVILRLFPFNKISTF